MQELKVCRPELPILKVNRRELVITEKDIIASNGYYWWFETKTIHDRRGRHNIPISKTLCKRLVKKGVLYLFKRVDYFAPVQFYKFDIEKLKQFLKEESEKKKSKEK